MIASKILDLLLSQPTFDIFERDHGLVGIALASSFIILNNIKVVAA